MISKSKRNTIKGGVLSTERIGSTTLAYQSKTSAIANHLFEGQRVQVVSITLYVESRSRLP